MFPVPQMFVCLLLTALRPPPSKLWRSADLKATDPPVLSLSPLLSSPAAPASSTPLLPGAKSYVKHIYF